MMTMLCRTGDLTAAQGVVKCPFFDKLNRYPSFSRVLVENEASKRVLPRMVKFDFIW